MEQDTGNNNAGSLAGPPYMQFWLPLSLGETVRILRQRKGMSTYQLASHIRKLSVNTVNIGTCNDIIKRAEASDPSLAMSELVIVGEALGIAWDLHIERNIKTDQNE